MNPDWMGGPDQVREADLQRAGAARQYREADLPLTKLWAYYYGIGGDVDELSLEAYLHEALHLPAVQVGLIVMALAELAREMPA
ncbi:hypothetical protein GA0061083_2003 [Pseudarthrobacter enclensis]|jgi:hypothetical protein|nr:hypothetical protein [Pseudarthrobacter enclensis]SCC00055.1 hypothetical protein GA0061083_2003 [Pseudarthrobacter enclensis]